MSTRRTEEAPDKEEAVSSVDLIIDGPGDNGVMNWPLIAVGTVDPGSAELTAWLTDANDGSVTVATGVRVFDQPGYETAPGWAFRFNGSGDDTVDLHVRGTAYNFASDTDTSSDIVLFGSMPPPPPGP